MAKVSVCVQTYNHAPYIAKALDSVLMQETGFDYEVIIGEDESGDGTREICIDYASRHPDRIRLYLRSRKDVMYINGRATGRFNFIENLKAAKGEYIALLDGDDYWTDPHKLQKQADFLDSHPDHTICFHRVQELDQSTGQVKSILPHSIKSLYGLDDLIHSNFIPTASVMIRNGVLDELPSWFYRAPVGDWPLFILCAQHGKIGLVNQVMAVYRIHAGGYWSKSLSMQIQMTLEMYDFLKANFRDKGYRKEINIGISELFCWAAVVSADMGDLVKAKSYLWKSIVNSPIRFNRRYLYKISLVIRVYVPFLWNIMRTKYKSKKNSRKKAY